MADFFFESGLFVVKTFTVFAGFGVIFALVATLLARLISRSMDSDSGTMVITRVNERLEEEREAIEEALLRPGTEKHFHKERRAEHKRKEKAARASGGVEDTRRRIFVVDFDGDIKASAVENLRREVTAILSKATAKDEVVVRLESSGGLVHSYGFGASQLARVRSQGVKLTVCVDRVAASGGYMMACVADRIIAAPFAVVGSIGVVAQLPNFHRILKKHDVDYELFTAGQYKRTVTVFGENTDEGRAKFKSELEDTHALFKEFVAEHRPSLDIDQVATGEIWLGTRALGNHLVDELMTSDEYLVKASESADILEVKCRQKQSLQDRLTGSVEAALDRSILRWWGRAQARVH